MSNPYRTNFGEPRVGRLYRWSRDGHSGYCILRYSHKDGSAWCFELVEDNVGISDYLTHQGYFTTRLLNGFSVELTPNLEESIA